MIAIQFMIEAISRRTIEHARTTITDTHTTQKSQNFSKTNSDNGSTIILKKSNTCNKHLYQNPYIFLYLE